MNYEALQDIISALKGIESAIDRQTEATDRLADAIRESFASEWDDEEDGEETWRTGDADF